MRDDCYNSVATLTTGVDDATYYVDSSNAVGDALDLSPVFSPLLAASCDYTLTLRYKLQA